MDVDRYLRPGRADQAFGHVMSWLTARGISVLGSRVLRVRGRTSGQWRAVPVNLLRVDGREYLVSARGQAQWVRNLRAAGEGELVLGRRVRRFTSVELADSDKPLVLRAYLRKWKFEVGRFFPGLGADSTDAELLAVAPGYPVFEVRHP